jgi:hypothetical protein
MAAATSAIFGSYLGAFGTVGGAALGAIGTTVVTHFFQHSIDTTRSRVKSKIRDVHGRPALEPAAAAQQGHAVRPAGTRGVRPLRVVAVGTLMIFLFALALVTGIEWAKGSSLSGGTGSTSVQGVLHPRSVPATTTPEPTTEPTESPAEESSSPSDEPGDSERSSDSGRPSDSELPSDSVRPSGSERPSDSVPPTGASEPGGSSPPSQSGNQRCRDTSLPPVLCGQIGPGSR